MTTLMGAHRKWFQKAHGHLHQWKADCPGTGTESSQPACAHARLKVRTKKRAPISFRPGREGMGISFASFSSPRVFLSPESSHRKTSEITLGLDEGIPCVFLRPRSYSKSKHKVDPSKETVLNQKEIVESDQAAHNDRLLHWHIYR
jgi:hypothetical protein